MGYWYPSQARATELARELDALGKLAAHQAADSGTYVPLISRTMESLHRKQGFPMRQIPKWVWMASQFRLHAQTGLEPALIAGAAVNFLGRCVQNPTFDDSDVQDLNWVLEATLYRLGETLDPQALRSCLSSDELALIEENLGRYAAAEEIDLVYVRKQIERQLTELDALSPDGRLSMFRAKVEALFQACTDQGKQARAARAALLYIAEKHDVVTDTIGVLGLLDDIYVIDWAYAIVEAQTRCLPLLDRMIQRWPSVADVALVGEPALPLDCYSQFVVCACLHSLFDDCGPSLLILREGAAYGVICAFFAAVQTARQDSAILKLEIAEWPVGQPVTISDGTATFRAIYQGVVPVGSRMKYRLGVRDRGSITMDLELTPYIARAPGPHARLSSGAEIQKWRNTRYVDPLIHLTGSSRRRLAEQEAVLLLGPRRKLDEYLLCLKPLGAPVANLVGAKYVGGDQSQRNLPGAATDNPYIYACSDADTAFDLICAPPEHIRKWRVIVDGARAGRALCASLATRSDRPDVPICVLGELHDREACNDLVRQGLSVWFLEDQDVEPPPLVPRAVEPGDDLVMRSIRRRGDHWAATKRVHDLPNRFLEEVCDWMCRLSGSQSDPALRALELLVSAFVQKALSRPLRFPETDKELWGLGGTILQQARVMRQYQSEAAAIHDIFKGAMVDTPPSFDKAALLAELAATISADERVAVVCRSAGISEACSSAARSDPVLGKLVWLNLEQLRVKAPYDRIIVPGWLDRMAMREIALGSYAAVIELLLFPFEKRWFEATMSAGRRWERKIEGQTVGRLRKLSELLAKDGASPALWREPLDSRLLVPPQAASGEETDDASDTPEFETLETRAIESLRRRVSAGREGLPMSKAQLVLFDEPGAYAFLPPTGRVIVLPPRHAAFEEEAISKGGAERMLFRGVSALEPGMVLAFPQGTDRDLIDARADQFLKDALNTRTCAATWKAALRRHFDATHADYASFAQRMAQSGQRRDWATVRAWATQTHTIAPRNYRETVPLLAALTDDAELRGNLDRVLEAIDLIYRARARAAEAVVRELFAGEIDVDADELTFELGGARIIYDLRRVRRLGTIEEVPVEIVGKLGRLGAAATIDYASSHLELSA